MPKKSAEAAKENSIQQVARQITKKQNHNPISNELAYTFDSDDEKSAYVSKVLTEALEYWNVPKVKTAEEMEQRTEAYFKRCAVKGIKPTVEEYALALGASRSTLYDWETGRSRGPVESDIIKRAKEIIALFDARAIMDGKMNPVTYIFRAKNYYGMKDQQDVVVTPNQMESRPKEALIAEAELLPED